MPNDELDQKTAMDTTSAKPAQLTDALLGTTIAERYQIVELIGSGGFGNVYRGKHLTLGTDIAIKVIHPLLSADSGRQARFEREAKSLSRIDSRYVVKTLDYVTAPVPCMIMEYFPGKTLDQVISADSPLPPEVALKLFDQLCEGLNAAHTIGFIHRDLKPSNILINNVEDELTCKILDFGIAKTLNDDQSQDKLTGTGELIGSPPYMSPEQCYGHKLDGRSDIYSLGCVMYETIVGRPPFTNDSGVGLLHQHLYNDPPAFSAVLTGPKTALTSSLELVVRKCMAKSVSDRYNTVEHLQQDLQLIAAGKKLTFKLPKNRSQSKTRWVPWVAAGACLIAGGLGTYWLQHANKQVTSSPAPVKETFAKVTNTSNIANGVSTDQAFHEIETNPAHAQAMILEALNNTPPENRNTGPYSTWLDLYAQIHLKHGNLQQAQEYEQKALTIAQAALPPDDPSVADRLNNLAEILHRRLKYAESEKLFKQAIAINSKSNPRALLANYNLLGMLYLDLGRFDEAAGYFQKAYDNYVQYFDPKGGAIYFYNMGVGYERAGKYQASLKAYRRALDIARENGSDMQPSCAKIWNATASVYYQLKDYPNAEQCYERELKILNPSGKPNPALLPVYGSLIEVKKKLGKTAEANALAAQLHKH